jgi:hypothetical protein
MRNEVKGQVREPLLRFDFGPSDPGLTLYDGEDEELDVGNGVAECPTGTWPTWKNAFFAT